MKEFKIEYKFYGKKESAVVEAESKKEAQAWLWSGLTFDQKNNTEILSIEELE